MPDYRQEHNRFTSDVASRYGSAMGGVAAAWIASRPARNARRELRRAQRQAELKRAAVDPAYRTWLQERDHNIRADFAKFFFVVGVIALAATMLCTFIGERERATQEAAFQKARTTRAALYPKCLAVGGSQALCKQQFLGQNPPATQMLLSATSGPDFQTVESRMMVAAMHESFERRRKAKDQRIANLKACRASQRDDSVCNTAYDAALAAY